MTARKTGHSVALDRRLAAEVAGWLAYYALVRARGRIRRTGGSPAPAIWFTPDVPAPRYLVRTAATWAGLRLASCPADADVAFFFEDATSGRPPAPLLRRGFNFGCADISKSRVATVFEEVFGYPLTVDPFTWNGEAVEKSELNGAHDGGIVLCPRPPLPGRVYQRLVDTVGDDGLAVDLRTQCVGGRVVTVWRKARPAAARFLPPNLRVTRHEPAEIFSAAELALIGDFARVMGADWCGLDILRDRASGRIYVVDVNKTDAGPITALSLREKLRSTALLADALAAMVNNSSAVREDPLRLSSSKPRPRSA